MASQAQENSTRGDRERTPKRKWAVSGGGKSTQHLPVALAHTGGSPRRRVKSVNVDLFFIFQCPVVAMDYWQGIAHNHSSLSDPSLLHALHKARFKSCVLPLHFPTHNQFYFVRTQVLVFVFEHLNFVEFLHSAVRGIMESSIEHFRKHTGPLAIQCDKITFAYKKGKPILEGLTMSVPRASTYSVLGASSAGKTTLLKLISGFMKPQKGSIKIFGQKPGSRKCSVPGPGVGFVSQDLCVYPNFSIKATLTYFAQINNVPYAEINKRIMYIRHYLELPEENRLVANLSGGQKRRVSLAIAMIHSPPLLILDEPTVGIDPYLRYKVWNYFDELRNKGHTVSVSISLTATPFDGITPLHCCS